jgi:ABC-type phosphate transport system auxiliary subunit
MSSPTERFQSLSQQLDALVSALHKSNNVNERARLLRRMKILIDEIDALNSPSLKRDK